MQYELITYFSTNLTMDEILDCWSRGTSAEQALVEMIEEYGLKKHNQGNDCGYDAGHEHGYAEGYDKGQRDATWELA